MDPLTGSAIFGFGRWLLGTRSGLVTLVLASALFAAGCVRNPTDVYQCSPGCFMDCQAQHMEGKAEWTREEAVETAEYCHSIRNECITCIERIEREGNACGWSKPCRGED